MAEQIFRRDYARVRFEYPTQGWTYFVDNSSAYIMADRIAPRDPYKERIRFNIYLNQNFATVDQFTDSQIIEIENLYRSRQYDPGNNNESSVGSPPYTLPARIIDLGYTDNDYTIMSLDQ